MYTDKNEEMILAGILTAENAQEYSANITSLAFAPATTQHPEAVYDVIRYLMDYEFSSFYGFSVNRSITEKQLEDVQRTEITTYPALWSSVAGGYNSIESLKGQEIIIQPLDAETVGIIEYMLNHISGAGLPFGILEYYIFYTANVQLGNGEKKPAELSEWILQKLDEYLDGRSKAEPFYDRAFMEKFFQ